MTAEPQVSVEVIRADIRATFEQVRKLPVPTGFTRGLDFTGIVPRVQTVEHLGPCPISLAEMLNLRIVRFNWHIAVRNGTPVWWITGTLEGVEDVVAGPARLE